MLTDIRLLSHQLAKSRFRSPKELVAWMGAVQAQEYTMAKWAVGTRLKSSSLRVVDDALAKGEILRTHILRPTWHFIAAEDIRWMLQLSGGRSLGITAEQLSIAAATIANDGVNPVTKKLIFDASLSPKITSLVATVGFYERTGDWLFTSGIPAKTGVGGGVMGIMPGHFGISAFAPPLDSSGNSVKAQLAIKYIMNKLGLSIFGSTRFTITG